MITRVLDTSIGPLPVRLEGGSSRVASWRATLASPSGELRGLAGAIGASEDSALDNLWAAVEQRLALGASDRPSVEVDAAARSQAAAATGRRTQP
jgi:hypothetical protein